MIPVPSPLRGSPSVSALRPLVRLAFVPPSYPTTLPVVELFTSSTQVEGNADQKAAGGPGHV